MQGEVVAQLKSKDKYIFYLNYTHKVYFINYFPFRLFLEVVLLHPELKWFTTIKKKGNY